MLLELFGWDREALGELRGRDHAAALVAAGGEQVCEQRLEDAEALGRDRAGGPVGRRSNHAGLGRPSGGGRHTFVRGPCCAGTFDDEPPQLRRLERDGAAVLPEDPAGEQLGRRIPGREDVTDDVVPLAAVRALDPPRRVGRDFDARLAHVVAELPFGSAAVLLDVELGRQPEIALAARGKADVRSDTRHPERADVRPLEVVADHVPRAVLGEQRIGIQGSFLLAVAVDRPVAELHRALLRDRPFELAEAPLELGRVVRVADERAYRGVGRGRREAAGGATEREVLQREPERLGVGEPPLEQVEARLQRRELLVVELELGEEVALRA